MPSESPAVTAQPSDAITQANSSVSSRPAKITSATGGQRIDPQSNALPVLPGPGVAQPDRSPNLIFPAHESIWHPAPEVGRTDPGSYLGFPFQPPIRHGAGPVDTATAGTVKPRAKSVANKQEEWEIVVVFESPPEIPRGRFTKDDLVNRFRSRFREFQSNPLLPTITIGQVIQGEHPEWVEVRVQSAVANVCASAATRCAKYLLEAAFKRALGEEPEIRVMRDETSDESVNGASQAWLPSVRSLMATFAVQVTDIYALNSARYLAKQLTDRVKGVAISPRDQMKALARAFIEEDCADVDKSLTPAVRRIVETWDAELATQAWNRLRPSNDANVDGRSRFWDKNFILSDLALAAIEPAYVANIEGRLMGVGPLPQSDADIGATKARMYGVVAKCAPETSAPLKRDFIDKYGEPARNNRVLLYGLAGTGKTTLVKELIGALQRPILEAQSLAQLLSGKFRDDMIRTATFYGRSDLVVHAHEMSLGEDAETLMKAFLSNYQRDGWLTIPRPGGVNTKLDVIVFFDANDSFVDRIFRGADGLQQAGNDRIPAIVKVVNGPSQRTLAATGRRDELSRIKLDTKKEQLRDLVDGKALDRSKAKAQWDHTKSLVTKTNEVVDTCLPVVQEAGNMADCTMGIVRRVMDDLYTRVQKRLERDMSDVAQPHDERLQIFMDFNRHMKDPRAPDSIREEIERMGGLLEEEPSGPKSVAAENERGMEEERSVNSGSSGSEMEDMQAEERSETSGSASDGAHASR